MTFEPTPKQTLILWDLLARGGCAPQADIPSKVGPKDRDALVAAKLLSTRKLARSIWLVVEDAGWSWASDHLDASLVVAAARNKSTKTPAKPPAPVKIPTLQIWLTRLGEFLRAKNFVLADVLPQTSPPEPPPKAPRQRQPRQPKLSTILKDVKAAVAKLEGSPQRDGVRLSALRHELARYDRDGLDKALVRLFERADITLMNLDNPRDIERERPAGINYKGQLLQVLWVK